MSKKMFFIGLILASVFGGLIALAGFKYLGPETRSYNSIEERQNVRFSSLLSDTAFTVPAGLNFVYAAEQVTPGVVHIKSSYGGSVPTDGTARQPFEEFFKEYFGESPNQRRGGRRPEMASGSGVIISDDGYIVTNNHVIDKAEKIEVTLDDNRTYDAKLIGVDPTTDLALIKINESNLRFVKYGNSDNVRVGEWVLAVGNPFELTSTVTAGIVSAKARNIGILQDKNRMQVESFLQTDAAVNPGNSGGALVNLKGELIGINTAIYAPTGAFAGYSFAVPVSLVRKVMDDLLEFGVVQRALLGVHITDVNASVAKDKGLKDMQGVYILGVNDDGAAADAGLEEGDVITKINGVQINTTAQLQEQIARHRPGSKIDLTYSRGGKERKASAVLKNAEGEIEVVKERAAVSLEGATFSNVNANLQKKLGINGGVRITDLSEGKWKDTGIKENFIITGIDKTSVKNIEDLNRILKDKKGGMLIEGVYPDGQKAFYGMGW
jgi:Do/DeqQ family serine protease